MRICVILDLENVVKKIINANVVKKIININVVKKIINANVVKKIININGDTPSFHYEVRIFHPGSPNVIANTFAITVGTSTLPGLTFDQKDLMKLDIPFI